MVVSEASGNSGHLRSKHAWWRMPGVGDGRSGAAADRGGRGYASILTLALAAVGGLPAARAASAGAAHSCAVFDNAQVKVRPALGIILVVCFVMLVRFWGGT